MRRSNLAKRNLAERISQLPAIEDYFDLYLIHSPLSGKEVRLETWRALVDAKKAGKIKSIGVSN